MTMNLPVISVFRKAGSALLLAAFVFGVAGDPVTDLLFPHQGGCEVCAALAGGHGIASPDGGPALVCDFVVTAEAIWDTYVPALRGCHPNFLSRAPPASSRIS